MTLKNPVRLKEDLGTHEIISRRNLMSLCLNIGDFVSVLENGELVTYIIVGIDPSGRHSRDNTIVCSNKTAYLLQQKDNNNIKWVDEDELVNQLRNSER